MLRNRIEAQQKSRKRRCLAEITNEDEHEELDNDSEDADAFIGDVDEPEHEEAIDEENGTDEVHQQMHNFDKGTTQKGSTSLWFEGFRYTHHKANAWRCSNRKCKARVTVVEEGEQTVRGYFTNEVHSHLPPTNHECEHRRNAIKEIVRKEPNSKAARVLTDLRKSADDETFVAMGSDRALQMMMKRIKAKQLGNVDTNNTLNVILPPALIMKDNESIVLYDSRQFRQNQPDVVFVFSTKKLLGILAKAQTWHIDGTFKVAPKNFAQCFVVGASVHNRMIIAAHALLPGKAEHYYQEVLEAIMRAIRPATPTRVVMDLEKAEMRAVSIAIPGTIRSACMFHYGQALYRAFKSRGLVQLYGEKSVRGDGVRKAFRGTLALPLIPPQHVRRAFSLIVMSAPVGMEDFFYYFARVYVGLTQHEKNVGAAAFEPTQGNWALNSTVSSLHSTPSLPDHNYSITSRQSLDGNVQFGIPSPQPSSLTMPSTIYSPLVQYSLSASTSGRQSAISTPSTRPSIISVQPPRWEQPIVKQPQYEIGFWNVHAQASAALARTNNGLESSHFHFMRTLNHHPALSDFLIGVREDIDKQLVAARSARNFMQKRHKRYVIQEQVIMRTLQDNTINYDDDLALMDLIGFLGHEIQGYAGQLRDTVQAAGDETINDSQ